MMNINDLLNKMEAQESAFLQTKFLAPILRNGLVCVRIDGVVCRLRVEGRAEAGWAILKPLGMDRARVIGKPKRGQLRAYLVLFPAVRLLLVGRNKKEKDKDKEKEADWLAVAAHGGDSRFDFHSSGPVPVHFVSAGQQFQQIIARFDGQHFWFEKVDRRRSPAIAAYLRKALAAETKPEALHKSTLSKEEREAYRLAYEAYKTMLATRRDPTEVRLSNALAHAGAKLESYIERDEAYTVTYSVDHRTHRSTIHKDDLTVLVAGICLSGQDQQFDLQSLVGVLREGEERHWRGF